MLSRAQCVWKTIIKLGLGKKAHIITKYKQQQQQQEKASSYYRLYKVARGTDAQYVANLVNVSGCKHATVQLITWVCYVCITTFFLLTSYAMTG